MSENFTVKTNTPALRKILDESIGTQGTEGYEQMKSQLRAVMGIPAPYTETAELPPTPAQQAESLPAPSSGSHIRVIYPSGNARFEIYSDSEEGLDLQEQRIRALYQ